MALSLTQIDALYQNGVFVDFGPSVFTVERSAPSCHVVRGRRGCGLQGQVRVQCPRGPGVYGMVDKMGELIYVGKAKSLRARLLSYFRPRSRGKKAGRIIRHAATLVWEACPSEFAALLRELELIRRWRPRCNVAGQPLLRQKTYICLGREPAPYVFLSRRPPRDVLAVFGPIPAGRHAQTAICRVNDLFQLRDCPDAQEMVFPEQGELFPGERAPGCLRYEIGKCLGPCTGTCASPKYSSQVRAARAFLAGTDVSPLKDMESAMIQAAHAEQFERAAVLRDNLQSLTWLTSRLERLRHARTKMSFIYPVGSKSGQTLWYLIHAARTIRTLPAPRGKDDLAPLRAAIRSVYGAPSPEVLGSHEHIDGMALVMAWFRKYPKELKKTLRVEEAFEKCG